MKKFLLCITLFFLCLSLPVYADPQGSVSVPASTLDTIPEYAGLDFITINDGIPDFYLWQITSDTYVHFSELDPLGRTGPGMACLGPETLPTEPRGSIGMIQPSGWHTVRYDDLIEDRYLYNRAHVIGYLLCGDNGSPENLFTGTRYLNSSSMLQFEIRVADYIESTGNHVIYRCSPKYKGNDLVATGVQIEAYSVEDNGVLCFNAFVFNIQPGISIDYTTGDSMRTNDAPVSADTRERVSTAPEASDSSVQKQEITYILNTNTHKFHYPSCPSVSDMKEKNKREFYGTREEAISQGYTPCGRCHP